MFAIHGVRAAALAAALLAAPVSNAAEVAGVRLDDRIQIGSGELLLNGAGLRSRLMFKVYVAGLYLPAKSDSAAAILNATGPRRMVLRMLRDVDADTLFGALRDGLRDNVGEPELAALQAPIGQFAKIFETVGNTRSGDTVTLDFTADGIAVALNGNARGRVADERLARALLRVWLGDKPVEPSLKKALLGS